MRLHWLEVCAIGQYKKGSNHILLGVRIGTMIACHHTETLVFPASDWPWEKLLDIE